MSKRHIRGDGMTAVTPYKLRRAATVATNAIHVADQKRVKRDELIRAAYTNGITVRELADLTGLAKSYVHRIVVRADA